MPNFGSIQKELIKRMVDGNLIAPKNQREADALERLRARGYVGTDGTQWKLLSTHVAQQLIRQAEREQKSQTAYERRLANMGPAAREQYNYLAKDAQLTHMRDHAITRIQRQLFNDMLDDHYENMKRFFIFEPRGGGPKLAEVYAVNDNDTLIAPNLMLNMKDWTIDGPYTKQEALDIIRGEKDNDQ